MEGLRIFQIKKKEELPVELLLLADPSMDVISIYINDCEVFIAEYRNEIIACYALLPHDLNLIEIKNLAVSVSFQGRGVGTILIEHAIHYAQKSGYGRIRICTGNSSLSQLKLYKKLGFTDKESIRGFFRDNYPEPIFENGMECVDLIVLERDL